MADIRIKFPSSQFRRRFMVRLMNKGADSLMPNQRPVAIVGGGPVGMMLALFLDRHNVPCVVFNSELAVRPHPKGSTHNARTMEHYRRLGFANHVRQLGLPADHPTDVVYFTRYNGWELARLPNLSTREALAQRAIAPEDDQIVEPLHRANQMYVEQFMFEHISSRPNITLRFGWQVQGFKHDRDGVTLEAQSLTSDVKESWRCLYLAGCDGGRSMVRKSLDIHYEGHANLQQPFFGGRMMSCYIRAPNLYQEFLGAKRGFQYWAVNPELRTAMVALNGRDEFLIWTPSATETIAPETVINLVRRCVGAAIEVDVIASHSWTAGVALYAERFGQGRVQLAGDAVHLFTPTGGFGMNTGIDDAANLSWKLAALVQGWGGAGLLESYEAERKPIAIRNTTAARTLARSVGEIDIPETLEIDSEAGRMARQKVGATLSTFGEEFASIGVQLGARYDGSAIIIADGLPPADHLTNYTPSGVPGGRAPHIWLDEKHGIGSSLYDHFGTGFTLLQLGPEPVDVSGFIAAATQKTMPLKVLHVPHLSAFRLYGAKLALIRPDQHIAWRGDTTPPDALYILDIVTGCHANTA